MSGSRLQNVVLIAASAVIAVFVIYYGVIFDGQLPDHPALRGKNDLALHAAAFLALSLPLLMAWPTMRMRIVVGLLGLAVAIEVVQFWQPGRNPGLDDVLASMAGVLAAGIPVALFSSLKRLMCGRETLDEGKRNNMTLAPTTPVPAKCGSEH